ncbi:MAG TPA: hypothetical protein VED41_00905 [Solirubrobacteraceae bacterium]|nr:hypothetical protein [Solirubrobacteraceae bacterium]
MSDTVAPERSVSECVVVYEDSEAGGWGAYLPPTLRVLCALGCSSDEVAERIE